MIGKCELPGVLLRAQPGQGERCVQTCALGRLFGSPPWQPVAGCSSRWLFAANRAVRRLRGCGDRRGPEGQPPVRHSPARPGPAHSPVPRPAIVVTVSRVRETFRAVPFIPGSCLPRFRDKQQNRACLCWGAEAAAPGWSPLSFQERFPTWSHLPITTERTKLILAAFHIYSMEL